MHCLLGTAFIAAAAASAVSAAPDVFVEARQPTPVMHALQPRQTQDSGTPLYLDAPSCGYFQCNVTYYPGDNATAHWLDAPQGNVLLEFIPHPDNATGHTVALVPGTTDNCDKGTGQTCGQFSWIVPSDWAPGNYTLRATSESDMSIQSYTDIILVQPRPDNDTEVPFQALDPTADGRGPSSSSPASGSQSTQMASPPDSSSSDSSSASNGAARSTDTLSVALVGLASLAAALLL